MTTSIQQFETILYVSDQQLSCLFYSRILRIEPDLNVPGMTEFILAPNCKLGLMPNSGIAKILAGKTPHPDAGTGIPRCELYFLVADIQNEFDKALRAGAKQISPIINRDWGHRVCYFSDPDGHILAFAETISL